ncbi:hypothetical protein HDU96_001927 [Phlyctochytrium bullatum]|nr:hypothetical protein HDU96_001927 [Phlyctochytrium bullatum]
MDTSVEVHGGFWLDASVILTQSLRAIHDKQEQAGAEAFQYFLNYYTRNYSHPVVESWFIATAKGGKYIKAYKRYQEYLLTRYGPVVFKEIMQNIQNPDYLLIHVCAQKVMVPVPASDVAEETAYAVSTRAGWQNDRIANIIREDTNFNLPAHGLPFHPDSIYGKYIHDSERILNHTGVNGVSFPELEMAANVDAEGEMGGGEKDGKSGNEEAKAQQADVKDGTNIQAEPNDSKPVEKGNDGGNGAESKESRTGDQKVTGEGSKDASKDASNQTNDKDRHEQAGSIEKQAETSQKRHSGDSHNGQPHNGNEKKDVENGHKAHNGTAQESPKPLQQAHGEKPADKLHGNEHHHHQNGTVAH